MADDQPPEGSPDLNYFACTLGQAEEINAKKPHSWKTINEFIDRQNRVCPNRPAVAFPIPPDSREPNSKWNSVIYTFSDLESYSAIRSLDIFKYGLPPQGTKTVALLCPSSCEFLFAWLALMRMGYSVLLVAPQCQPSAIAHLCQECKAYTLVYDEDYSDLAKGAREVSDTATPIQLAPLCAVLRFEACRPESAVGKFAGLRAPGLGPVLESDVAYFHHTSGTSTGLPKPIPQTHHAAIGVLPALDSHKDKATFTTTPLYHGGIADCLRAWTSGQLIWLFPGAEIPITAYNILKSLQCAQRAVETEHTPKVRSSSTVTAGTETNRTPKVRYFSSVPYVLQMMAAEPGGLRVLKEMELVGVGGAALPPYIGDDLVEKGVNLLSRFGSAECGFLMSSHRNYEMDKEWQYLRSNESPHLSFEPQDGGLAELVIRPSWPHMAKRNRDNGSYATSDLFKAHATIPNAWRYHSRADSQLTLITGKKFDPAPLEAHLAPCSLLSDVLIFGNGQQYIGALLFRSSESEDMTSEDILNILWPTIRSLNAECQAHIRLSRSMLMLMPKDSAGLAKSSKGTTMRGRAEELYASEISKAYEGTSNDITEPYSFYEARAALSDEAVIFVVHQTVQEVIDTQDKIPKDADLFSYGVDSVACMQIRALLQSRLLAPEALRLPLNVVYSCGTVKELSKYIIAVRKCKKVEREDEIQQMCAYVSKHSNFTNIEKVLSSSTHDLAGFSTEKKDLGHVVVLTGATGALGAHILDQLRSSRRVKKIYCLVRATSPDAALERVSKSLIARNKAFLDYTTSDKILCLPCKLSDPLLGLISDHYVALAHQTTIIIHAAWAVNFSMRLSSFEKDHIAGIHNLINLALASPNAIPPHFIFCSSTASVLGPNAKSPIPEQISNDPLSASPLGYSRSKWVAEAICEQAHLNTRLRDRIAVLRIGQLCGDTMDGIWNKTEAWPLMLSSVKVTGSLPHLWETLAWLPVDIAAKAVMELALAEPKGQTAKDKGKDIAVYHILNPSTQTTWSNLLRWTQDRTEFFNVVKPAFWVGQLESLKGEDRNHPAMKLLSLWKEQYCSGEQDENRREVTFEMEKTKKTLTTMRNVQPIDEEQYEMMWEWIEETMM